MERWGSTGATRSLVFVAVVAVAFWRPLFAGGTLAPDDQVWVTAPFGAVAPAELTIEVAEPDATVVHSAWTRWGEEVRSGSLTQLGDGRSGAPVLADGVPITHLVYALVPAWFAPGLIAALAVLLGMTGTERLLDRCGFGGVAAGVGGLAYGLSGLMFVWIGWPHATAFALVPWVFAAGVRAAAVVDRRSVLALGGWIALLAWCGVWAITAYTLVGLVIAVGLGDRRSRRLLAVIVGMATGLAFAAPHLLASASRWSWADTSAVTSVDDSSAAVSSLLTLALGSLWGADSVGYPWIGSLSAQLSISTVGFVAGMLALVALLAPGDRRLPFTLIGLGVGVAYVGGPFVWVSRVVAGTGAEMTHARVLLILGVAIAAAQAIDVIEQGAVFRRPDRFAVTIGIAVVLVAGWGAVEWVDAAHAAGAIRTALAESTTSVLAAVAFGGVVMCWRRGALAGEAVALVATALIAVEALSFGMAIPTVTDRDERLSATPTHAELLELVGEDGLVVGEGPALAPSVAARFGPNDLRVPRPRSAGETALLSATDPGAVRGGATVNQPVLSSLDLTDPAWRRLGVDAVVTSPWRRPPGIVTTPLTVASDRVDPAGGVFTTTIDLTAGLRAVELDLQAPFATPVEVDVTVAGRFIFGDAVVVTDSPVVVPIEGDSLAGPASVTVRIFAEAETATLGVDAAGEMIVGVVGSDDDGTLRIADGLTIVHRPVAAVTDAGGADVMPDHVDDRRLGFRVDSERPTVVWTDIVDRPGWTAEVDGSPGDLRGDVVLGVGVPSGMSEVEFRYRPPGLVAGVVVIALTVLAWVLVAFVMATRRSPDDRAAAGSVASRD